MSSLYGATRPDKIFPSMFRLAVCCQRTEAMAAPFVLKGIDIETSLAGQV
jgi:hypothetical protein